MWAIWKLLPLTQYWRIFTFFWCLWLYAVDLLPIFLYQFPQWISAKISKFDWNSKTNESFKRLPSPSGISLCRAKALKSFPDTLRGYLLDLNHPERLKNDVRALNKAYYFGNFQNWARSPNMTQIWLCAKNVWLTQKSTEDSWTLRLY